MSHPPREVVAVLRAVASGAGAFLCPSRGLMDKTMDRIAGKVKDPTRRWGPICGFTGGRWGFRTLDLCRVNPIRRLTGCVMVRHKPRPTSTYGVPAHCRRRVSFGVVSGDSWTKPWTDEPGQLINPDEDNPP